MGALHPVLFFVFIYGISLFLAIFVCRTVYYSVNGEVAVTQPAPEPGFDATHTTASATALK
jgi:hypothetical protein